MVRVYRCIRRQIGPYKKDSGQMVQMADAEKSSLKYSKCNLKTGHLCEIFEISSNGGHRPRAVSRKWLLAE